jgi:hypothetical protein
MGKGQAKRTSVGRFASSRLRKGETIARKILNDREYRENLLARMRAGVAGPVEVHLWRLGFGDPPKNENEREDETRRFARIREELLAFLREAPEEARALSVAVTRRPLPFPRPALPPGPIDVEPQPAAVPDSEEFPRPGEPPEPRLAPNLSFGTWIPGPPPPPRRRRDGDGA